MKSTTPPSEVFCLTRIDEFVIECMVQPRAYLAKFLEHRCGVYQGRCLAMHHGATLKGPFSEVSTIELVFSNNFASSIYTTHYLVLIIVFIIVICFAFLISLNCAFIHFVLAWLSFNESIFIFVSFNMYIFFVVQLIVHNSTRSVFSGIPQS